MESKLYLYIWPVDPPKNQISQNQGKWTWEDILYNYLDTEDQALVCQI